VSDQDLNFYPPERREAKKAFEPPPWEQDQFDELARRKEAERTAAEIVAGAANEDPASASTTEEQPIEAPSEESAKTALYTPPITPADADQGTEEDPRIETMLIGLRHEEPPFGTQMWKVATAAGAVLALVGVVLTVWGLVAMGAARRAGAFGALGGGILVVFGLGFVGVGGWMAFRTLRQQGVL
jgi:hypothetical protein